MKLARRNRWSKLQLGNVRTAHDNSWVRTVDRLESLESRVLLSGETVTVAWGGQYYEAAKDQYLIRAAVTSAAALVTKLNNNGLHVSSATKLAPNVFVVTDSIDTVGQVETWRKSHPKIVTSISVNGVFHKAGVTPSIPLEALATDPSATRSTWTPFWHLENFGQESPVNGNFGTPGADINAFNAWALSRGKQNQIVAVLDTGFATQATP